MLETLSIRRDEPDTTGRETASVQTISREDRAPQPGTLRDYTPPLVRSSRTGDDIVRPSGDRRDAVSVGLVVTCGICNTNGGDLTYDPNDTTDDKMMDW